MLRLGKRTQIELYSPCLMLDGVAASMAAIQGTVSSARLACDK